MKQQNYKFGDALRALLDQNNIKYSHLSKVMNSKPEYINKWLKCENLELVNIIAIKHGLQEILKCDIEFRIGANDEIMFYALDGNDVGSRFYDYDKRGVRAFVQYSTANGKWAVECYRKKRKDESEGNHDWQMVREGHIQSYDSREEAERKALELAEQICMENGY